MTEVCLHQFSLAALLFGAIFGTLILIALFLFLFYNYYWRQQQHESKMFYVERGESVQFGEEKTDGSDNSSHSVEKREQATSPNRLDEVVRRSVHLSGHSQYKETSSDQSTLVKLTDLGITVVKSTENEIQVESVQRNDFRFFSGDRLTLLNVDLQQLPLEKAATLLELLAPFKVQLEVLRNNQSELQVQAEVEQEDELKEVEQEQQVNLAPLQIKSEEEEVCEALPPPPPPSSPPSSPTSSRSSRDSRLQPSSKSGSEDESARIRATKIPTPKISSRSLSKASPKASPVANMSAENLGNIYHEMQSKYGGFGGCHQTTKEVLVVHSEETDEFGLTTEQYNTLENNRRRLETERQQLRDLGILS